MSIKNRRNIFIPISQYLKNLREKVGKEILQIPSVSAIIRDENDRVLMVKNDNVGVCGLPAGAIDLGEIPSEAVVREVFEETGLQVKPVQIAGVFGGGNFRYICQRRCGRVFYRRFRV